MQPPSNGETASPLGAESNALGKRGRSSDLLHEPTGGKHKAVTKLLYNSREKFGKIKKSSVLDKVKNFLPQIADANNALTRLDEKAKQKLDIEDLEEKESSYVQMDLALAPVDSEGHTFLDKMGSKLEEDDGNSSEISSSEEDKSAELPERVEKKKAKLIQELT